METIFTSLGGNPLALKQAGSYIAATKCTVREYLEDYDKHFGELDDEDKNVKAVWTISFKSIQQLHPDAARFLLLWAYLDRKYISYELLAFSLDYQNSPGQDPFYKTFPPPWFWDCIRDLPTFRNKVVQVLRNYSLINISKELEYYTILSRSPDYRTYYSMHPLLHKWCYHSVAKEKPEFACWAAAVLHPGLSQMRDGKNNIPPRLLDHSDRLSYLIENGLPDRVKSTIMRADLLMFYKKTGDYYLCIGMFREAVKIYEHAYRGLQSTLGPPAATTLYAGMWWAVAQGYFNDCCLNMIVDWQNGGNLPKPTMRWLQGRLPEIPGINHWPTKLDVDQSEQLQASLNSKFDAIETQSLSLDDIRSKNLAWVGLPSVIAAYCCPTLSFGYKINAPRHGALNAIAAIISMSENLSDDEKKISTVLWGLYSEGISNYKDPKNDAYMLSLYLHSWRDLAAKAARELSALRQSGDRSRRTAAPSRAGASQGRA